MTRSVALSRVQTYGSSALNGSMSTTAMFIEKGRCTAMTWHGIGVSSKSTGNEWDTSPQLLNEGASIIASADRLLGRSWDRKRLARWEALLDDSLFRPAGRSRAMSRWQRAM